MKKILNVLVLMLAINFIAALGGIGWLFQSGKLDKTKVAAIKEMLFAPPPSIDPLTTQPSTQPTTQPASRLDEMLAKYSGRRAGEQVEVMQSSIDVQAADLDRRSRDLDNLMGQILREKAELTQKSAVVDAERQRITSEQNQQATLANDQGFQDSLKLFVAMPAKQAKSAILAMPDDVVVRYLQAMPPRAATKIIKECKTPEEQDRINRVLDRMRRGGPATQPSTDAATQPSAGVGATATDANTASP